MTEWGHPSSSGAPHPGLFLFTWVQIDDSWTLTVTECISYAHKYTSTGNDSTGPRSVVIQHVFKRGLSLMMSIWTGAMRTDFKQYWGLLLYWVNCLDHIRIKDQIVQCKFPASPICKIRPCNLLHHCSLVHHQSYQDYILIQNKTCKVKRKQYLQPTIFPQHDICPSKKKKAFAA